MYYLQVLGNPKALAILYWGRGGGGLELFYEAIRDSRLQNLSLLVSSRPILKSKNGHTQQASVFNLVRWIKARRDFKSQIIERDVKTVLIVMASPWDILIGKQFEECGVEVIRVIHDGLPHPGDWFPTKFWISWLTKDCSRIITLSSFVAEQLINIYSVDPRKISVSEFPRPIIDTRALVGKNNSSAKKILLIGRGKKYQGQKLLEEAWDLLPQGNMQLVIAGKGFESSPQRSNVIYKNWWMTRQELINEIATSDLVVFPYLEASQSGTIPICNFLQIPVVVTPVGGLPQQVKHGENGFVAVSTSVEHIAASILDALAKDWSVMESKRKINQMDLIHNILNQYS